MKNILIVLVWGAILAGVIGMINPNIVLPWMKSEKRSKLTVIRIYGAVLIICGSGVWATDIGYSITNKVIHYLTNIAKQEESNRGTDFVQRQEEDSNKGGDHFPTTTKEVYITQQLDTNTSGESYYIMYNVDRTFLGYEVGSIEGRGNTLIGALIADQSIQGSGVYNITMKQTGETITIKSANGFENTINVYKRAQKYEEVATNDTEEIATNDTEEVAVNDNEGEFMFINNPELISAGYYAGYDEYIFKDENNQLYLLFNDYEIEPQYIPEFTEEVLSAIIYGKTDILIDGEWEQGISCSILEPGVQ